MVLIVIGKLHVSSMASSWQPQAWGLCEHGCYKGLVEYPNDQWNICNVFWIKYVLYMIFDIWYLHTNTYAHMVYWVFFFSMTTLMVTWKKHWHDMVKQVDDQYWSRLAILMKTVPLKTIFLCNAISNALNHLSVSLSIASHHQLLLIIINHHPSQYWSLHVIKHHY